MNRKFKDEVLDNINHIYEEAKDCHLDPKTFARLDLQLTAVAEKLELNKEQAFFFSILLPLDLEEEGVTYNNLSRYFGCNTLELLNYSTALIELEEKELITRQTPIGFSRKKKSEEFHIADQIKEDIIKGNFPLRLHRVNCESVIEVLEEFYSDACLRDEGRISTGALIMRTQKLLQKYQHFNLIKKIIELDLGTLDEMLLLYLLWKTLSGHEKVEMGRTAEGILDNRAAQVRLIQDLAKGTNPLVKQGLVEIEKAGFLNTSHLKLTEKGLELLENEGLKILNRDGDKDLLLPEKIPAKKLFFNRTDFRRIQMLEDSLQEEKLKSIRARLEERNLPLGVTAILHGPPGTGKTESVYQMARKTGRKILKVEISETKSKWFGDSEKIIKEIFSKYQRSLGTCARIPILLFNEADAILSRRKDIDLSGVAQTENAIQNILLEELENFKGIFIATTNLISNLDTAFERRFLFKIQYEKPEPQVKQKIWQDRIPALTAVESLHLAESFDLSGGQIENICRKILINEVLHEDLVSFEQILEFCRTEKFSATDRKHIGFGKN